MPIEAGALTAGAKPLKPVNITPFGNTPVTGASTNFKYGESPVKGHLTDIRDFDIGPSGSQINLQSQSASPDLTGDALLQDIEQARNKIKKEDLSKTMVKKKR